MSDEHDKQPIIIIKRIKKAKHPHHGGAWKIAYADFVTAMMAFFMLMWLLALLNKYQLEGVAKYFKKPVKEAFVVDKAKQSKQSSPSDTAGPSGSKGLQKGEGQNEMADLSKKLEKDLKDDDSMNKLEKQVDFQLCDDGVRVSMHDLENKEMFTVGKAAYNKEALSILKWVGQELNKVHKKLIIIGHTDGTDYHDVNYTNWELSVERANATRRALVNNGLDPSKILRIIGAGDTNLLNKKQENDPKNRRIEIVILNDEAATRLLDNVPKHTAPAPVAVNKSGIDIVKSNVNQVMAKQDDIKTAPTGIPKKSA